jgi:hypothetical protein
MYKNNLSSEAHHFWAIVQSAGTMDYFRAKLIPYCPNPDASFGQYRFDFAPMSIRYAPNVDSTFAQC